MKNSIKKKMFIVFSAFTLLIVMSLWIFNYYFIDEYYIMKKKNNIIEEIENIDKKYNGDIDSITDELRAVENVLGGNLIIYDRDTREIKYTSLFSQIMGNKRGNGNMTNFPWMMQKKLINSTFFSEKFNVNETKNQNEKKQILMTGILNNGDYILFVSPIEVISKNIKLTSNFYIYTGIGAVILGLIAAYIISVKMTKPVLILTNKAKQMSELDFSNNDEIKSNDEIGQLSKVMNDLSSKLDSAITELNNANTTLQEDIDKERELESIRRDFISNVSHELKTPIALIQGYAEGLRDKIVQDEESMNFYTNIIYNEAVRMDKLVKDLLVLSRFESGKQNLSINDVDLLDIVSSNVKKFKAFAKNNEINITLDSNVKNCIVKADKEKIEQVINNLLSNAVKYSVGIIKEVKVIVREKADNKKETEKVEVRVFNTCNGILEEDLHKIWDRFYKVDKSRNREAGGTGLGLAIVKRILELHESDFGVKNVAGGVEFFFDLKKSENNAN